MEFHLEKPKCTFEVPDKPTVRQQLGYFSASATIDGDKFLENAWTAAKSMIIAPSWKCEVMPLDADLDKVTDPRATEVILWAGMKVREYMNGLDQLPKN